MKREFLEEKRSHPLNENIATSEQFFSTHAEKYAKSQGHAHGPDLSALINAIHPAEHEIALDIATGTGFTAMELAKRARRVIAVDITEKMLEQARRLSLENGIKNISFEFADATSLPYEPESFDIVTVRRAAHHINDIPLFLSEARRVLRKGGRLGIDDMTFLEGTEDFSNTIERLRDSSHGRGMTRNEWQNIIERGGMSLVHVETVTYFTTLEQWLYPVAFGGVEEKIIREEWARLDSNLKSTLGAKEHNGKLEGFNRSHIVLVALKP